MKNKDVNHVMQCFFNVIKICIQKHISLLKLRKLLVKCFIYLFYTEYLHAEINRFFDKFILKIFYRLFFYISVCLLGILLKSFIIKFLSLHFWSLFSIFCLNLCIRWIIVLKINHKHWRNNKAKKVKWGRNVFIVTEIF